MCKYIYLTKQVKDGTIFSLLPYLKTQALEGTSPKLLLMSFRVVSRKNRDKIDKLVLVKKEGNSVKSLYEFGVELVINKNVEKYLGIVYNDYLDLSDLNKSKGLFLVNVASMKEIPFDDASNAIKSSIEGLLNSNTAFRLVDEGGI